MSTASWFEFDPEESLPEEVQDFLAALREQAATWLDADPLDSQVYESLDGHLVLGLDVGDHKERCILRTLRVDLDFGGLKLGEDETGQFATPLSSSCAEYSALLDQDRSPKQLAHAAARWFREQMVRPIELLEWLDGSYRLRRWRLADSKRWLCWSASDNTPRAGLGEPDQISLVRTLRVTDVSANTQQSAPRERAKSAAREQ